MGLEERGYILKGDVASWLAGGSDSDQGHATVQHLVVGLTCLDIIG